MTFSRTLREARVYVEGWGEGRKGEENVSPNIILYSIKTASSNNDLGSHYLLTASLSDLPATKAGTLAALI